MNQSGKYVVVFTSVLNPGNEKEYEIAASRMCELAKAQPGYIKMDSVREGGLGITVSYWDSLDAVNKWKWNGEHLAEQKLGRQKYYKTFQLTVARIEKEVEFTNHG